MSFNQDEKARARSLPTGIHIENVSSLSFSAIVGDDNSGNTIRSAATANDKAVFAALTIALRKNIADAADQERLVRAVARMEASAEKPETFSS